MARPRISPSARKIPISISVSPAIADKIDEYSHQLRFSRSKFLQQAVTEYMTRNIVNPNDTDLSANVHDMTLSRRVAVGLAALQEANRSGETIPKAIMDALRRELRITDKATEAAERQAERDAAFASTMPSNDRDLAIITGEDLTPTFTVEFEKQGKNYVGFIDGKKVASIRKIRSKWVTQISGQMVSYKTLREAKQDVQDFYVNRGA